MDKDIKPILGFGIWFGKREIENGLHPVISQSSYDCGQGD